MNWALAIGIVGAFTGTVAGLMCLALARVQGWGHLSSFAGVAFTGAVYSGANLAYLVEGVPDAWILQISSLSISAGSGCCLCWLLYAHRFLGLDLSTPTKAILGLLGLVIVLAWVPTIPPTRMPVLEYESWGVTYRTPETTGVGDGYFLIYAFVLTLVFATLLRGIRNDHPGIGFHLLGFSIFYLCVIEELLVSMGRLELPYFADVGYLAGVLSIFGTIVTRTAREAEDLRRLNDDLMLQVEKKTQAEEALRRGERLASLGTLAAGIAHEINNPVGAILNAAELSLLQADEPERGGITNRDALEDIVQHARRCGKIVRNILQFARNEVTERECVEIIDIVRRAVRWTEVYAKSRDAKIEFAQTEPIGLVRISPIEIEQVLVNIIRNGIEARPDGATVRIRCSRIDNNIVVEVTDDGRGIQGEALKHIFDPFYTDRLAEGGTGLGLSISHGIVLSHGGRIDVKSDSEAGTSVSIVLCSVS